MERQKGRQLIMGIKIQYSMTSVEVPDNPTNAKSILKIFENNPFILLDTPEKQRCLWIKFVKDNVIWRSQTSIINIEEISEGLIVKTRGETYHIHKCKLT